MASSQHICALEIIAHLCPRINGFPAEEIKIVTNGFQWFRKKALNLPLRGKGTAAAVDEGRYGSEWYVFPHRSRPLHPSSVSLTRASTTFYGIAATGSYVRFNSLRDAPPAGEALSPTFPSGEGGSPQARRKRGVAGVSGTYFPTAPAQNAPSSVRATPASSP